MDGRAQPTGIRKRGDDATLLMMLNAHHDLVEFTLPIQASANQHWTLMIDTNLPEDAKGLETETFRFGQKYAVTARSFLLFALVPDAGA